MIRNDDEQKKKRLKVTGETSNLCGSSRNGNNQPSTFAAFASSAVLSLNNSKQSQSQNNSRDDSSRNSRRISSSSNKDRDSSQDIRVDNNSKESNRDNNDSNKEQVIKCLSVIII